MEEFQLRNQMKKAIVITAFILLLFSCANAQQMSGANDDEAAIKKAACLVCLR